MSGPFGPSGTEAVWITGICTSAASLARAVVLARNSATLMSLTFWNRPDWWSSKSRTVSVGSSNALPPPGACSIPSWIAFLPSGLKMAVFPLVIHFLFVSMIFVFCFCLGCRGRRTRDDFCYSVYLGPLALVYAYNSDDSHQKG